MEKHKFIHKNPTSISLLSLLKTPVLSYLLHFLNTQECYECRKVNITLYNAFYYFYGNWASELNKIAKEYNLKISFHRIDLNREQAIVKQREYPMKEHKGIFVQIREPKERIYALFNSIEFAWSDNKMYWNKTCYPDSLFGGPSYSLISVCWVDPKLTVYHITPKNYYLYLRHGLRGLKQNELKVSVLIDSQLFFTGSYPTNEMIKQFDEEVKCTWINTNIIQKVNLVDVLLCKINTINFKPKTNKEYEIRVEFEHNNNWWKSGWVIDAFYLDIN